MTLSSFAFCHEGQKLSEGQGVGWNIYVGTRHLSPRTWMVPRQPLPNPLLLLDIPAPHILKRIG